MIYYLLQAKALLIPVLNNVMPTNLYALVNEGQKN
jgi:hypothetical protein